ncbi:hypothetical protein LC085_02260 [Bacillus tianshenii]|uniref:tubby C-terminal domain-like protein n=1 Tax=Sutcliffiella tianshenii TaxID=1463404 RepID=UPI001CD58C70|nr:hypothetical protein [Bacillus tianshenii]MCA1318718.1 hypothetical protein [Bacillus tianshenii]
MQEYTFTLPLFKYSSKPIIISDLEGQKIASFERIYRKKWIEIMSKMPIPIISEGVIVFFGKKDCKGTAQNGEELIVQERTFKENLLRMKWDVLIKTQHNEETKHSLKDISKVKTHGRFIYEKENEKFTIEKNLFNRTAYVKSESKLVAEIKVEKRFPKPRFKFVIHGESLISPLEIGVLYYIFNMQFD